MNNKQINNISGIDKCEDKKNLKGKVCVCVCAHGHMRFLSKMMMKASLDEVTLRKTGKK